MSDSPTIKDGARLPHPFTSVEIDPTDYTQLALGHALATASKTPGVSEKVFEI